MSKRLYFLLSILLIILCVCGCSNTEGNNLFEGTLSNEDKDTSKSNESTITVIQSQVAYMSFEECLSNATNVVSATYTGTKETHGIFKDLVFSPVTQYKGEVLHDDFHVRVCNEKVSVVGTGIRYSKSEKNYVPGETYLLVLEKRVSVYNPYDVYLPLGNIMISADDAVMYDGKSVQVYSTQYKDSNQNIEDYINNIVEKCDQSVSSTGTEYIREKDLNQIIDKTTTIAIVTPTEYIGGSENNNTSRYICTVNEVIKGDIQEKNVKIIFVADTVEVGKKYVVMMEKLGVYYILSSKNSVHRADDKAVIQQVKNSVG